ncbi:transcription cofactor vestigial-like protein 3 isoform X2 [Engraulis encrasicolus]|uniref:transcription cofactor vestigial-like protein 3 isoform X2 n=1 Tax=Engraulis encrasicolus TaxID=184585 RepID=UPI002FD55EA8
MSCLDVMYHHQSYGALHYLPATTAAAAAAYRAAYQQQTLSAYNKMQESTFSILPTPCAEGMRQPPKQQESPRQEEVPGGSTEVGSSLGKGVQPAPAEAEYLSAKCVVFTYFQGNIGDVVDEHFSRALSQTSAFTSDAKPASRFSSSGPLWRERGSLPDAHCGSSIPSPLWTSTGYSSQASPCLSAVHHPDYPTAATFHSPDATTGTPGWSGHSLPHQLSMTPAVGLPDSWHYGLSPQAAAAGGASYPHPHMHDLYSHHHHHVHPRHPHAHNHPHPHPHMLAHPHGPSLESCFSPLLLHSSSTRSPCSLTPPRDGAKTDLEAAATATATQPSSWQTSFQSSLDTLDTNVDQDKIKAAVWF